MSLGGFGREAERFRDLDDAALQPDSVAMAALREAQTMARGAMDDGNCPSCPAKDAEIARLQQARDTALEALERERCARRGTLEGQR